MSSKLQLCYSSQHWLLESFTDIISIFYFFFFYFYFYIFYRYNQYFLKAEQIIRNWITLRLFTFGFYSLFNVILSIIGEFLQLRACTLIP